MNTFYSIKYYICSISKTFDSKPMLYFVQAQIVEQWQLNKVQERINKAMSSEEGKCDIRKKKISKKYIEYFYLILMQ